MNPRTRASVLAVSIPVMLLAVVGGYLGQAMGRDDTYKHLAVFEDVVSIVVNNYVEDVDPTKAMRGALHGLADALDADSAYLTPALAKSVGANEPAGPAETGIQLMKRYYLRVVSVRDGSPAARAGLRTGDFIRVIGGKATRNMSTLEGTRLLRGAAGSKVSLVIIRGNATDPHVVDLIREKPAGADVASKLLNPSTGYVRIVEFSNQAVSALKPAVEKLTKAGVTRVLVDLRGTARGDLDSGVAAARLFVKSGALTIKQGKGDQRETVSANTADGVFTTPLVLLTTAGTAGAAEIFAAAIEGAKRGTRVGERTLGRAARQRLVRLPDGSGLWLSYQRYLTPGGEPIHEKGLKPDVAVAEPDVNFGAPAPAGDPILEKALEDAPQKKAA
jgi:carboxyl-terminal processing protease